MFVIFLVSKVIDLTVTSCLLALETRAVATCVSGSKWAQSTELDISEQGTLRWLLG